MEVIAILLFVLLIITLVGHGIWILLAAIIRAIGGRERRTGYEATVQDDRIAAGRYLQYLAGRGLIDTTELSHLMGLIAREARGEEGWPRALTHESREDDLFKAEGRSLAGQAVKMPTAGSAVTAASADSVVQGAATWPSAAGAGVPRPDAAPTSALPDAIIPARATDEPETPVEPKRPFSQVLMSFMAEKNIRWGELVGGLLILCCSTALVISLWAQIEAIPVLKFAIFTTVTAALFGVGLFVHHRWRLPTTGHAVLIVSSLLVPLNLLAFAALAKPGSESGLWNTGLELASVGMFGWLLLLAGRILMPGSAGLFAFGVLGLAAASLLVRRIRPDSEAHALGLAASVILAYAAVMLLTVRRESRRHRLSDLQAKRLFLQLASLTFASAAPLGLLLLGAGPGWRTAHLFAPVFCAFAAPAFLAGLFIRRRIGSDVPGPTHTVALSIALTALSIMLAAVGLAWPDPSRVLPGLIVNGLAILVLSRFARHWSIAAGIGGWFAAAWVLIVLLATGSVGWSNHSPGALLGAIASARTGEALIVPVVVCVGLAEWLSRRRRRVNARGHAVAGTFLAIFSVVAVAWFGFGRPGDPHRLVWIACGYAGLAFWAAWRLSKPAATVVGSLLVQLAVAQWAVHDVRLPVLPWSTALMIGASLLAAGVVGLRPRRATQAVHRVCIRPLGFLSLAFSLAALFGMAFVLGASNFSHFSYRMYWFAGLWLVLAAASGWAAVFAAGQVALIAALCTTTQQHISHQAWYAATAVKLGHPSVWLAHLNTVAGACLAYAMLRFGVSFRAGITEPATDLSEASSRSPSGVRALLCPGFSTTDRWLSVVLLLTLLAVSAWGVWPSVCAEHGWADTSNVIRQNHAHAAGLGGLAMLSLVAGLLVIHLLEGRHDWAISGLLIVVACATALGAARCERYQLTVEVWRWLLAGAFILGSIAWISRSRWRKLLPTRIVAGPYVGEPIVADDVRVRLAVLYAGPALLLTATFMVAASHGDAPAAVRWSEWWLRASLVGPVALIAVASFLHGVHARHAGYAAAATLLLCLAATGAELAMFFRSATPILASSWIRIVQLNAILAGVVALAWRGVCGTSADYPKWPLILPRVAVALVFAALAASVWLDPGGIPMAATTAGSAGGWAAVVLLELAILVCLRRPGHEAGSSRETIWVALGASLIVFTLAPFDAGNWICFHALLLACPIAGAIRLWAGDRRLRLLVGPGWPETFATLAAQAGARFDEVEHDLSCARCGYNVRGLSAAGLCPECGTPVQDAVQTATDRLAPAYGDRLIRLRRHTMLAVLACVAVGAMVALRGTVQDPQCPWWSAGGLVALGMLCMILAAWAPRRAIAYLGGLHICGAVSVWWLLTRPSLSNANPQDLVHINVIAMTAAAFAWLLTERRFLRSRGTVVLPSHWPAFQDAAAVLNAFGVLAMAVASTLLAGSGGAPSVGGFGVVFSLLATLTLWLALTREPIGVYQPAACHVLGLAALLQTLVHLGIGPDAYPAACAVALAGYVLLSCVVRAAWRRFARPPAAGAADPWFMYADGLLAMISVGLSAFVSVNDPSRNLRAVVVLAPALLTLAGLVATAWLPRSVPQTFSLAMAAVSIVLVSWIQVSPATPAPWLHRSVGVICSTALATLACGIVGGWVTGQSAWKPAIARFVASAGLLGLAALLYCGTAEAGTILQGGELMMAAVAAVAMIAALIGLIVAGVLFAAGDRFDPLGLSPARKEYYVYAAETLAAVLALHIRATMPWLFTGVITQYWPVLMMLLAFVGVSAGEVCDRYGQRTLGRPLGRTGLFLPAITTVELFLAASRVHYSVVLLTVGAFYGILAALRRSAVMAIAAGVALNGSLWYLLYHTPGLAVTQHPQLWFIPPAFAILAAGHLTRGRLSASQLRSLNYACLLIVYLSSTADIFLIGVARAPWLPLVLGGFSVVGVFVGVGLRLRSFLMLGTGFLCVSLLAMIWHATSNLGWTWVWYVAGIALGATIITIFALFERKRSEMNAWVDQLKTWAE